MNAINFSSLIDSKLVFLRSKLTDITEIYGFMLTQAKKRYRIPPPKTELLEKLLNRKLDESIILPTGTAIPHLHLEDFNDSIISVLVPEVPIQTEYGNIRVFFLILSGKNENSIYLHILKSVIQVSKNETFFAQLLAAKNPATFVSMLAQGEYVVKQAINVGDIMSTHVLTVTPDTTLEQLSTHFYEHNMEYFPVVDSNNKLIGEVTVMDYIMAGFPQYTKGLKNLNFLKSFEPFENLLQEERNILVKSIMRGVEVSVPPETALFKAVFLMHKHAQKNVPVVVDDKVVGVINFMDVLRKVLKG